MPAGRERVMGNQLSTWNLTIQSAVAGENFNYNPNYNQVTEYNNRLQLHTSTGPYFYEL